MEITTPDLEKLFCFIAALAFFVVILCLLLRSLKWAFSTSKPLTSGQFAVSTKIFSKDPLYSAMVQIVNEHIHALALERRSKLVPDKYKIVDSSAWQREIGYFTTRVALPSLTTRVSQKDYHRSLRKMSKFIRKQTRIKGIPPHEVINIILTALIDGSVTAHEKTFAISQGFDCGYETPSAFEHWCANQLRQHGWEAHVSGMTGDQGVDVRANRNGQILVVQCKFYNQPVGNKAIQEVYAGKTFYRANLAIVVSTAGFTKSARALAAQTGVHLLTPDEMASFCETRAKT